MPGYDLSLIVRAGSREEVRQVVRRVVSGLMVRGAVVRDIEGLGTRNLPYKVRRHDTVHTVGCYFSVDFVSPTQILSPLTEELNRDPDLVRSTVLRSRPPRDPTVNPCLGLRPHHLGDKVKWLLPPAGPAHPKTPPPATTTPSGPAPDRGPAPHTRGSALF